MLDAHTADNPLDDLEPVTDAGEIRKLIEIVGRVHVSRPCSATPSRSPRPPAASTDLHLGASPRATLHLVRAAKASAAIAGTRLRPPRRHPRPGPPVLAHRLLPNVEAAMGGRTTAAILAAHRGRPVPVPVDATGRAAVREALAALTVRGRAFLAAGITTVVCAIVVGQTRWSGSASWSPRCRCSPPVGRPLPLPARAGPHGQPAARRRRAAGDRRAHRSNEARTPTGVLLLEERLPYVLGTRPRFVLEGLGHGWRRHATLPGALGRPRAVRDRSDVGAGHRPVRLRRARPHVPRHGPAHRHTAHRPAARASRSAAPGPGPATTGRGPSPPAARRTSRSASTGAATTCAASTGAARPAWAS